MISLATRTAAALATRVPVLSRLLDRLVEGVPAGAVAPPSDGWLHDAIQVESVNRYDAHHRPGRVQPIEFIVGHYTASPYNPNGPDGSDLDRMRRWAVRTQRPSSTHFVGLRDGRLVQMVSLNARAWHVTSRWPWPGDSKGSINSRSIGFDFENVGWLREEGGRLLNSYGRAHHGPVAYDENGKPWEPYTEAQIATALKLLRRLGEIYPQLRDGNPLRLIGHHDAQPTRVDPGPMCPLDELRAALQGAV